MTPQQRYLFKLKYHLPLFISGKKQFVKEIQAAIEDYCDNNISTINYESIVNEFGEPTELASSFCETQTGKKSSRYLKAYQGIIILLIGLVIIFGRITFYFAQHTPYYYQTDSIIIETESSDN